VDHARRSSRISNNTTNGLELGICDNVVYLIVWYGADAHASEGGQMDWVSAIIAGAVSLVVGFTTAIVTIRVANQKALVDEKLARLRADLDDRIAQQKLTIEQQQTNRRPFLQKQLELCFEATDAASRLATEMIPTEWEKARFTFWRLYWGILGIVEDEPVAGAMVTLGKIVPATPVNSPELPMTSLRGPALVLARAARNLMRESWDVDLSPITRPPT
jgi:hypothetical protein